MNTTNYIRIFRGDDSDALGYQTIVGTIKTDVDLAGCKAVFRFLGFYAEFDPIPEDKKLTIVIPAQASRGFPPGVGYASLKVIDAYGKIRTFTNRIPVIVDTMTPSCGCGEFEVSFSPFPNLEPLRIFMGPNADDFDQYTGFISKTIDRASLAKYGLVMLADAMSEDGGTSGKAASPLAVKAAYDAIINTLTDNYYTANETDEAINRVSAYYITYDTAGNPFPTYAALANAQTVYSGGEVRVPTRNDYCVVLADETHGGSEYRYIYAVAEGETIGSWQPQFPVGGVMTVDQTVQKNSQNPVSGGGVWSMLWGALSALPTGFASLYDWCVSQLAGKASTADATLTPIYSDTPTFSEWTTNVLNAENIAVTGLPYYQPQDEEHTEWYGWYLPTSQGDLSFYVYDIDAVSLSINGCVDDWCLDYTATRTRTDIIGYTLGSQSDKPLQPKGEYAPAANIPKTALAQDVQTSLDKADTALQTAPVQSVNNKTGAVTLTAGDIPMSMEIQTPVSQSIGSKANRATNPTAGNLAALDAQGNPTNSLIPAANVAMKGNIPYNLGTPTVIDTASSETVEGETVYYGEATLADRTANIVQVTAATALDELRITFPAATSGKVRDFGLRVEIGTGSAALTAPALVPIAPTGDTIKIENNAKQIPALADGTATAKGVTLLYFSENASGVFVVKGEQVEEVA